MKLRQLISTLFVASLAFLPGVAAASAAALYVSPASGSVKAGSIIPVQIRVNTGGDPVNAIQANLTYSASQLSYDSFDAVGSAFSLTANVQATSGSVKLARAIGGGEAPVTGDVLFATVYFKAVTTAGTASVAVASDSHVVRSTDSVDIIAGAAAATGTKASATGAPKPTVYPNLTQAKAAVVAAATPTPAARAAGSSAGNTPAPMAGAAATPTPRSTATAVLAWNSPAGLGGLAVLGALIAVMFFVYMRNRRSNPTTVASAPVSAESAPVAVRASVDEHTGAINPQTIYPTSNNTAGDSDQIER